MDHKHNFYNGICQEDNCGLDIRCVYCNSDKMTFFNGDDEIICLPCYMGVLAQNLFDHGWETGHVSITKEDLELVHYLADLLRTDYETKGKN